MQLHYSHRLMQPEGHLGALFSIYECILYICVRAPARETTRLNGPDWKQKSLIRTPHYKATCYSTTLPTHNWVTCHVWNTLSPHTDCLKSRSCSLGFHLWVKLFP
nr:MAG TPA: hypothetical protein [Caudoviricetes sp.]